MSITSQQYANLAEHTYDRRGDLKTLVGKDVTFEGTTYTILEYANKPSGYQGTIYQRKDTGEIVVAHRGTEFGREPIKDGLLADGGMVFNRVNSQAADAIELTRHALERAKSSGRNNGHTPEVTVTGHSLGGTLAQITAHHFDLRGETFNAYGALSLGYRIPEGGSRMVNHVMAGDPVSAASAHYGEVRVYAQQKEINTLSASGYLNTRLPIDKPFRQGMIAAVASGGSHSMHNFLNVDGEGRPDVSSLGDPATRQRAQRYDAMIDKYRGDVEGLRRGVTLSTRGPLGTLEDLVDGVRGPLPAGEPARREATTPGARSQSAPATTPVPAEAVTPLDRTRSMPAPADDPMLARFRADLPAGTSDAKLAHLALQTRQQTGISDPERISSILTRGEEVFVTGVTPGFRARLDLAEPAPPLAQTLQQTQAFDQQPQARAQVQETTTPGRAL